MSSPWPSDILSPPPPTGSRTSSQASSPSDPRRHRRPRPAAGGRARAHGGEVARAGEAPRRDQPAVPDALPRPGAPITSRSRGGWGLAPSSNITGVWCSDSTARRTADRASRVEDTKTRIRWFGGEDDWTRHAARRIAPVRPVVHVPSVGAGAACIGRLVARDVPRAVETHGAALLEEGFELSPPSLHP
jgi:hypothetical protein